MTKIKLCWPPDGNVGGPRIGTDTRCRTSKNSIQSAPNFGSYCAPTLKFQIKMKIAGKTITHNRIRAKWQRISARQPFFK